MGVSGTLKSEKGGRLRCCPAASPSSREGAVGWAELEAGASCGGGDGYSWRDPCRTARGAGRRKPLLGISHLPVFLLQLLVQNLAGNQLAKEKCRVPAPESPSTEEGVWS